MTKEELYELVDIDSGDEFTYFENLSALLEADEKIESDVIYALFSEVDLHTLAELFESYFYDIMESMPEDLDVYNLLEAEKRNLVAMAEASGREEEGALRKLSEEIERFHDFFSSELNCEITRQNDGKISMTSLRDAIYEHRAGKLHNELLHFDISKAADYVIEEYIMSIGDLT